MEIVRDVILDGVKLMKTVNIICKRCSTGKVCPYVGDGFYSCAYCGNRTDIDEAKASGVETLRTPPTPEGVGIRAGDLL